MSALLAQAQLLSRTKRYPEARTKLETWLENAGGTGAGSTAQYLLASTLDDLDDPLGRVILQNRAAKAELNGPALERLPVRVVIRVPLKANVG